MNRSSLALVCLLLVAYSAAAQQPAQSSPESDVQAFIRSYVETFNKGDAEALAVMWTENGVHVDRESGEQVEGREAIRADLTKVFQEQKGVHLSGRVDGIRFLRPDIASVEGETVVSLPDTEPIRSVFSAILVQEAGKWHVASIEESIPNPDTPKEALRDLEWLVGSWVDEGGGERVDTTVRWSPSEAFLIRSYMAQDADGNTSQGTQVIGWDPRSHQVRSWQFNSDGSFGDGVWSQNGDDWHVKTTQTLADGRAASGTYVMTRESDDRITVQLIGHEVEGEPRPASEAVTVVRVVEAVAPANDQPATTGR